MDQFATAEVAHLLIDIRNNLEYQNLLLLRNTDPSHYEHPGLPPARYADTIDNQSYKTSFKEQVVLANDRRAQKRAARIAAHNARKEDKKKIENRP